MIGCTTTGSRLNKNTLYIQSMDSLKKYIKSLSPNRTGSRLKMKNVRQIKTRSGLKHSKKLRSSSHRRRTHLFKKLKIVKKKVHQVTSRHSKIRSKSPYSSSRKSSRGKKSTLKLFSKPSTSRFLKRVKSKESVSRISHRTRGGKIKVNLIKLLPYIDPTQLKQRLRNLK